MKNTKISMDEFQNAVIEFIGQYHFFDCEGIARLKGFLSDSKNISHTDEELRDAITNLLNNNNLKIEIQKGKMGFCSK